MMAPVGPIREQLEGERGAIHHLPPSAAVARPRQPLPPERDGGGTQPLGLRRCTGRGRHPVGELLQHEHCGVALDEGELGRHVAIVELHRHGRAQDQSQRPGREDHLAVLVVRGVRRRPVAEAGCYPRPERQRPAHALHPADQPAAVGVVAVGGRHRHEVVHLADPARRGEPGDQHVGVGEVELPGSGGHGRGQGERPTALGVQDRGEHAGSVEAGAAVPIDGAVGAHQRGAVQVADQTVLRDGEIAAGRGRG